MSEKLSHIDSDGNACMVDVGDKSHSRRVAVAQAVVRLSERTFRMLVEQALPKGDVLTTAKLAGIMGAKQTSALIPLCHPLALSYVDVSFDLDNQAFEIAIRGEARTTGQTGVEMEALTAVNVAALAIYDMCKAVQKDIVISDIRLLHKSGGKSGTFNAA